MKVQLNMKPMICKIVIHLHNMLYLIHLPLIKVKQSEIHCFDVLLTCLYPHKHDLSAAGSKVVVVVFLRKSYIRTRATYLKNLLSDSVS